MTKDNLRLMGNRHMHLLLDKFRQASINMKVLSVYVLLLYILLCNSFDCKAEASSKSANATLPQSIDSNILTKGRGNYPEVETPSNSTNASVPDSIDSKILIKARRNCPEGEVFDGFECVFAFTL
ncbi:hypothetical protein Trydic_g9698 [Trypoxylus dichotomus]